MKKMRILWIPHGTWERKVRQRDQYFIDKLKNKHEIHVLSWTEPKGPRLRYFIDPVIHVKAFQDRDKKNEVYSHHFRRLCLSRFNLIRKINEYFFQKKIRKIVKENDIHVVICGPNHYLNGFPPFDLEIPIIFDYSDYIYNEHVRKTYLENSDIVLCVSKVLLEEAKKYNKSFYFPNGVDIDKFERADPTKVIEKYKLKNSKVISLIGITCSKSLYFLDAFPLIKKEVPEAKFLVVGDSYLIPEMKKRVRGLEKDVIFTGWVDYEEIQDYFAASDVGIYPVDKNLYFDSACPIKVLEYTAAKKPVVTPPLLELKYLNFPNLVYHDPTSKDFADKIIYALTNTFEYPDLAEYDWDKLTEELERILNKVIV